MLDTTIHKQTQIICMYVYDFLCRHIRYITDLIKKMQISAKSLSQTQSNNDIQKQANQMLQLDCSVLLHITQRTITSSQYC